MNRKPSRDLVCAIAVLGLCAASAQQTDAQNPTAVGARVAAKPAGTSDEVKIWPIRRNVFMLVGDGANIVVQTEPPRDEENFDGSYGRDTGVLVIDTGTTAMSAQLLGRNR